jgi:ribonuclease Z
VYVGDTSDATGIKPLASESSLLVHEATNAFIQNANGTKRGSDETVKLKAQSRGHSTPGMAGHFAKMTLASHLVMNHLSPRYVLSIRIVMHFSTNEPGNQIS